jgi:hypothetical protein
MILLTAGDTTRSAEPAKPFFPPLQAPADASARAERDYLFAQVIDPLMDFSLAQEAATQAEAQRADGLVAKIKAFNATVSPPKRRWWPFARDKP